MSVSCLIPEVKARKNCKTSLSHRLLCNTLSKNSVRQSTPPDNPDIDNNATIPLTQNDIASLIIPINTNDMHCSFVSIDFISQTVTLYDSLSGEYKSPGDGQEHNEVHYLNVKHISDVIEYLYSYDSPHPFYSDDFAELLKAKDKDTTCLQRFCSMYDNCSYEDDDSFFDGISYTPEFIKLKMNRLSSILNIALIWEWIIIDWNCETVTQKVLQFNKTKKTTTDIKAFVKYVWNHAIEREKDLFSQINKMSKDGQGGTKQCSKETKCNESGLFSWKLCISKEMPQQHPTNNNCSLFSSIQQTTIALYSPWLEWML